MESSNEQISNEKSAQPVNVYVRIRPFNEDEIDKRSASCVDVVNTSEIQIRQLYSKKSFRFSGVFDSSSSQQDVFDKVVSPLILEVLKGYNCTVFAYGQTGTGKTHTIFGTEDENAGIVPRSINKLFEILKHDENRSHVRVSFLELYNEELFDLLSAENAKALRLYDDKNRKGLVTTVQGLEEMTINTKEEIYHYLKVGYEKRCNTPTLMNSQSGRSHCIFTFIVNMREISPAGDDLVKMGKLSLVDLAGSENIGRSGSVEKRFREVGNINQSLCTLGRVITALNEKSCHVPYRESKLTRILGESLGGSTKTSIITTISSASINVEETSSTLEYAMKMRNIQNTPKVNQPLPRTTLMHWYKQEINRLKKDLHMCNEGTGICLNEENYLQMINKQEKLKNDLDLKTNHLESLEEELKDVTAKLEIAQKNLRDVANNNESLMQQRRILEENLLLCKEETNNEMEQLEELRVQHDQIVADSKELSSVIEAQYNNKEILQRKLSSLHDASRFNEISVKEFCEEYNKLSCAMQTELHSCIHSIQTVMNSGSESVFTLRKTLEETYSELKKLMTCLLENVNAMERNKMKDVFISEVGDYIKELDQIIKESFAINSTTIQRFICINLHNMDSTIQEMNEYHRSCCDTLASNLNNIATRMTESSNKVAHLLDGMQQTVVSKFEIMDDLNLEILNKMKSCAIHSIQIQKDEISDIRSQVLALQQEHSASSMLMKESSDELMNSHSKMQETSDDIQTLITGSFDQIKNESTQYLNHMSVLINKQLRNAEDMKEKETCTREKLNKEIDDVITKLKGQSDHLNALLSDFKNSSAEFASSINDSEKKYDNYVAALSESRHSVIDNTSNSKEMIDSMYETVSNINLQVLKDISVVRSQATSTNERLHESYDKISNMIHEFSDVKLMCLTHANDTPQRSQKAITLIDTLNISSPHDVESDNNLG